MKKNSLHHFDGVVLVDAGDGGEGVIVDVVVAKELTTLSETFLYEEAHAHNLGTRLAAQMNDTTRSMTVGQEVINKEYPVILRQIPLVNAYRRLAVTCE